MDKPVWIFAASGKLIVSFSRLTDMSGFEVLVNLVPIVHYPEVAVIVLTRLTNQGILEFALKSGAQAALHKDVTSGDLLDTMVLKGIAKVQKNTKEHLA